MTTLNDLPIGKTATVAAVGGEGSLRQHFLDMGIIPLVDVTMVKHAPMGDPLEVRIHSYELTLRRDDARKIEIVDMRDAADAQESRPLGKPVPHPGLGEGGKFHDRADENPLPEGTPLAFALVGNQNCGKTTLFNQLTGSNQHVGNFPGVTVDRKDGCIKGIPRHASPTCRASTPCRRTPAKRWSPAASCWTRSRAASSTSWTPRTSSATCT